jgi:excisionase family DNA binding protein
MAQTPHEERVRMRAESDDRLLEGYLELPEAAKQAGMSLRTFQRMIERREVPFVDFGIRRLVPIDGFRQTVLVDRTVQPITSRRGSR